MAYLNNIILDEGLNKLTNDATVMHICSQEPATFNEATVTYTLGNKTGITVDAPVDASPGRQVLVNAVSEGDITGDGTASHWALVDPINSLLLASDNLDVSQVVTNGNKFNTTAFNIIMPGLGA